MPLAPKTALVHGLLFFAIACALGYPSLARFDPRAAPGLNDTLTYLRLVEKPLGAPCEVGCSQAKAWRSARWFARWLFLQHLNRPAVAAVPVLESQCGLLLYEVFSIGSKIAALAPAISSEKRRRDNRPLLDGRCGRLCVPHPVGHLSQRYGTRTAPSHDRLQARSE